jgi:hypothetical protein
MVGKDELQRETCSQAFQPKRTTMIGTVTSIRGTQQTYCLITDLTGTDYFAHRLDFVNPGAMRVGSEVEFNGQATGSDRRGGDSKGGLA